MTITHEDISAATLLEDLPPEVATKLRTMAITRRCSITDLIKEALLKISTEITQHHPKGA